MDVHFVRCTPEVRVLLTTDTAQGTVIDADPPTEIASVVVESDMTSQLEESRLPDPLTLMAGDAVVLSAMTQATWDPFLVPTARVWIVTVEDEEKSPEKYLGTGSERMTSTESVVSCVPDVGGLLTLIEPLTLSQPLVVASDLACAEMADELAPAFKAVAAPNAAISVAPWSCRCL